MRVGIKAKQVIGVTSIVGVSIVALSVIHLGSLARVAVGESRARGELITNAIFHRARVAISQQADPYQALRDDAGLGSILESSIYSKSVTYAAIVDPSGRIVAHSDPRDVGQPLVPADNLDTLLARSRIGLLQSIYADAGRTVEVQQPLLLEQRAFGSIRVGVSTLLIRRELDAALAPSLVTMIVALVVAVVVAMLLAQLLLRPIHIIRSGLTRLGRGEFGVTLDLPQGDEFGDLGSFFNDLSAHLSTGIPGVGAPTAGPASPPPDRSQPPPQTRDQVLQVLKYSRKLMALSRLTVGVAHEVKNPLNAMTIHLELLRQKLTAGVATVRRPASTLLPEGGAAATAVAAAEPSADLMGALRHAGVIADEIKRLDEVVQGFLKFTRPEELKLQPVHVQTLIGEVIELVDAEARKSGVKVVVDCPSGIPPINADSAMMRQAVLNLAINACQAMPAGGTLRIACAPSGEERVTISVIDTGVGIKSEDLNRIFDLYFTTKERGSGIGLSLVYRIVQMHDGEVEVESAPGRGTTFRLLLPQASGA
jgi:signal transduction histidine kinase